VSSLLPARSQAVKINKNQMIKNVFLVRMVKV
jgi:hypothetical protein